jgi:nucleotide-binding universal stress UspA family protein
MERIVIGADIETTLHGMVKWAARFVAPDGEIVLVHALRPRPIPDFLVDLIPGDSANSTQEESVAAETLENVGDRLGSRVLVRVERGRPADVLARVSEEVDANLIAIGPRGKRARRLGTTAEQLVRLARRPVLIIHEPRDADPQRILCAIDGSPHSAEVLRWTGLLMKQFEAEATILHVLDADCLPETTNPTSTDMSDRMARIVGSTETWLAEQARTAGFDIQGATIIATFGGVVHEISARTENHAHDLVVMGSRGLGGIRREILGSVASGVLRAAWSSVLIV